MYASMVKEPKAQRTYFRVPQSFKDEFAAAALTNGQDPSEAFRYIGRQFIDRVKLEKPADFANNLEQIRAVPVTSDTPTTKQAELTASTPRQQKVSSKKEGSGRR